MNNEFYGEDGLYLTYYLYFNKEGKKVIKSLSNSEYMINCKNILFKSGNTNIKAFDFLKNFGTLYNLLNSLLNQNMIIDKEEQVQCEMILLH